MDVAASSVVTNQSLTQLKLTTAMVKQSQQAEQAIVNLIASTVSNSSRGQNLNISV